MAESLLKGLLQSDRTVNVESKLFIMNYLNGLVSILENSAFPTANLHMIN